MEDKPLLLMKNIVKTFPGVKALKGVDLEVKAGEVHALVGENGAGKSTLMKIISGAQSYTSGKMYVNGKEVVFKNTKQAEESGIAMIYQELNTLPELSVAENMYLGRLPKKNKLIIDYKKLYDSAQKELNKLHLDLDCHKLVKNLTVAQAQMVEIAKCLSIGANLIIMDEPTATLSDDEIETLFAIINDLKHHNIGIIYISHRMDEIFKISDCVTVFRDGMHISTCNISDTNYDKVVSQMVGKNIQDLYPKRSYSQKETVFEAINLSGNEVKNCNFSLHKGEILGVAGLLGSGSIELSKIIYGAKKVSSGTIKVNGKNLVCKNPRSALNNGIALVSDDRKNEGLLLERDIKENISLSSLSKVSKYGFINKNLEMKGVNKEINMLNIKLTSISQLAQNLSGGNQQKVVFAKVLESNPDILILDEPTRGVDVGAKAEIYEIMNELTKMGKSIILISTDLPELIGMSDRAIILRDGLIVKELAKKDLSQESILAYASGGVVE